MLWGVNVSYMAYLAVSLIIVDDVDPYLSPTLLAECTNFTCKCRKQ